MRLGSELAQLTGYPFEVRYSEGAVVRARAAADVAADAYAYFTQLFSGVRPNIAIIVADRMDWKSRQPYGLPYFNDDPDQICPGIIVMPAGSGDFWIAMGQELLQASPRGYRRLTATYSDGSGGLNLQPFFDLITIHELGHAFEVLGDLNLPTFWLSEIFANLALHTFLATRLPDHLTTLETLPIVGANSARLDARIRSDGYSTLEELEAHYTGGDHPMGALNYVWYQYRWQRLAAAMYEADGEGGLVRFWEYFHARDSLSLSDVTSASLAPLLSSEVSETLGRAVREWR